MSFFNKLFVSGTWNIAYRREEWKWPVDLKTPFETIQGDKGYWYADPMIVSENYKFYLFCEAFNFKNQLGEIAVFSFDGEKWSKPRVIISNNYHMSYPCVFGYKGKYYMIPETQEAMTLDIYECIDFPYKWEKRETLLEGVILADSTVFEKEGSLYVIGQSGNKSHRKVLLYLLDIDEYKVKLICKKECEKDVGRSAGYLISKEDGFIRPTQDSRYTYGMSVIWNYLSISEKCFDEKAIGSIDNSQVIVGIHKGVDRIHTFSRAGDIEVIDYSINRIDIFKRFKILWRQFKRQKRNYR